MYVTEDKLPCIYVSITCTYLNNHALTPATSSVQVCTHKAVQETMQNGELNAGDAEAIKAFRCTFRIDTGAVSPDCVFSSDNDEAVAQNI